MIPGEAILTIILYPLILIAPGILWTFLFKDISARLGIIKRISVSVFISITIPPLIIFLMSQYLNVNIFSVSVMLVVFAILPIFIAFIFQFIPKMPKRKPTDILTDVKSFFTFSFKEFRKALASKHHLILLLIIIMGVGLTLAPHFGYSLPIHTDEWHYMAFADNLISLESTDVEMPYYGWDAGQHWEIGFIIFIASIKMLSCLSWPVLFTTLPAFLFCLTILTAYLIGKRYDFGLHSAFLVALAPSTLQFLGPAFLVPISLGIFLILMSIYLLINHRSWLKYFLISTGLVFAFLMHPPTGGYLFISLCAILLIFMFTKQKRESLLLGSVLGLFLLAVFLFPQSNMQGFTISELTSSGGAFLPLIDLNDFIELVSYIPFILAVFGIAFLIRKKESYSLSVSIVLIALALFVISLFYLFPDFFQIQAVFDRAIIVLTVIVALVAGAGLFVVQKNVSKPLFIVLVSCVLLLSIYSHANEPYYNIISDDEYQDFEWIRDNLNSSYDRAILDPWKAIAFTPVTGKMVFFRIPQGPSSVMEQRLSEIGSFFGNGCADTDFLIQNGITIVYTDGNCLNPNLVEVHSNVYILNV